MKPNHSPSEDSRGARRGSSGGDNSQVTRATHPVVSGSPVKDKARGTHEVGSNPTPHADDNCPRENINSEKILSFIFKPEDTLSSKWHNAVVDLKGKKWYYEKDIKDFIKKIKAEYDHSMSWDEFTDMISKHAGAELT